MNQTDAFRLAREINYHAYSASEWLDAVACCPTSPDTRADAAKAMRELRTAVDKALTAIDLGGQLRDSVGQLPLVREARASCELDRDQTQWDQTQSEPFDEATGPLPGDDPSPTREYVRGEGVRA